MNRIIDKIETYMDNFKIKKKLFILYIFCVLVPLVLTDGFIFSVVFQREKAERLHRMESVANAVEYSFANSIHNADSIANGVNMNQYINEFLNEEYESPLEYVTAYQQYRKNILFDTGIGMDNIRITMYSDNDTIVRGGGCGNIAEIENSDWYKEIENSDLGKGIVFLYDTSRVPIVEAKRSIFFAQKMNYYGDYEDRRKMALIRLDYSTLGRNLVKMNYEMPVYICSGNRILLSNVDNSLKKNFEEFTEFESVGYAQNMSLYGTDFTIYVLWAEINTMAEIKDSVPLIILLVFINLILPFVLVWAINRSFTMRIRELSDVFQRVDDEKLVEIQNVRGKDEIGSLMKNYNRMVQRINALIRTVYIGKMKEQEMMVARQNAELLALHSQINPHFLFNALESIRMHSILKKEMETADMVERLALLQRRYLEWGEDYVEIDQEIKSVRDYLELQKYRFGERLSYSIEIEEECGQYKIPKMSIVTFVENACVHGIESKTSPGWIFVRVYKGTEDLCLEIEDTGIGMEEVFREELLEKMRGASMDMLKEKGRVGIINACLRLKMMTQNEVSFELDGEKSVGTIVGIRIPLKYL
ncbi:MAG: histidine kinase [Lachnospiraceae bacterium]|nr:histidine kinase [Lachnospiraceae bacterium]